MMTRLSGRLRSARRLRTALVVAGCLALGALVGVLALPQYFSDAATTATSTIYKTATNAADGSVAASSDAPGGAKTGTAKPGDTLKWVVNSQNNTSAPASVNLKDVLSTSGAYVPGSLQIPPSVNAVGSLSPQYSVDGGSTWVTGTPPANANGVGFTGTAVPQGTAQLSPKLPSPQGVVLATSGGDGYNAAVQGGLTYAAFHHNVGPPIFCGQQTGATCPGWPTDANAQYWSPTVGTPIGASRPNYISSWQNGTWISGNKLFWLAGPTDARSTGTGCLNLATTPPTSCGYTVLTNNPVTSSGWAQIASSGIAASNGRIYAVATANAVGGVGEWDIVCINPATGASCGVLPIMTGVTSAQAPQATTFGNYVFASVQKTPTSSWQTFCYVAGGSLCAGNWPVTTSTSSALGGNVFAPVLSTTGAVTGVCTITNGAGSALACWNLSGSPLAVNPYVGTGAGYNVATNTSGEAFMKGSKVYVSGGNVIRCLNFGAYSGTGAVPACAGFTPPVNNKNYTVRDAGSITPNCLVADGDSGQITFFDGLTGGGCLPTSAQSLTAAPLTSYCGSGAAGFTGWGALTVPGLVAGTYANSTVTLRDQNNAVISGFNGVVVTPGGSLNLSSIPKTVTSITATVTVVGVTDASGVTNAQIQVTWVGAPPEMCFQTVAPPVACDAAAPLMLSNSAKVVTVSATGSDSPGGNTTGATQFAVRADASQCGLSLTKTSGVQTARPGDKVTYTVAVKNTGTQAYSSASFADDLTDLLKDAAYNDDHAATAGAVSYAAPVLRWSGGLAAGASASVTYSVTVTSPNPGDHSLVNTVVSPSIGSNCGSGSKDAACTVTVPVVVADVTWRKIDATAAANILPGAEWTLTPVDAAGKPTGPAIVVTDCVAGSASQCSGADIEPVGGMFRVTNLGPGTYQLVETRAPVGFTIDPTPVTVTVAMGMTPVTITGPNVKNHQLPVPAIPLTGGLGTDTLTFTGAGVLAITAGLAGWVLIRRRRAAQ